DPNVDQVRLAARNWFERGGGRAMLSAVWALGRSLRGRGYDLGIDVRGDLLSVLVLALAGIPRRVGWSMGGGAFLLTDVADWQPGRHEVRSRLALLDQMGVRPESGHPARVLVHVTDRDRSEVAARLRDTWSATDRREESVGSLTVGNRGESSRRRRILDHVTPSAWTHRGVDEGDWLHAGRFGSEAPLLAVHLGAGTSAKRWPDRHWRTLIGRFLDEGWRVVMVGGSDDARVAGSIPEHSALRDWTGTMSVTQTAALLERADLFIGSDSGPSHLAASAGTPSVVLFSGTNRSGQWRPWSRRSLILKRSVPCRPCHHKVCPLADHPCMTGLHPDRVYRAAQRWWARLHRRESPHAPL
ncbi:MAG: glycosyltransferase family 9 protein, partial [Isosphaeraceae bacterium]